MKKAILFVAVVIGLVSCKKDQPAILTLNGTWELKAILGGFGPGEDVTDDNRDKYVITLNSKYVKTDANKVQTRGSYTVNLTEERNGYRFGTITFTNPAYTDAFAFKADTIIIGSSAADGPSYKYVRVKR
ncbi:hypothetical protein [Mucilaginibacter sp. AK015]|uniref:hypothetical protein n=1 Tax=Mucilaginibacter sp. AK015 TaxID=2723072 RepID=UPI001614FE8E|nr:hypothetical protein [Mucilaginibacter sp. AK015]MBB5396214.1 hypothetical protein [Mucilaginibacter sp. AK015]